MKRVRQLLLSVAAIGFVITILQACSFAKSEPVTMGELESLHLVTLDSTRFQLTAGDVRSATLVVVFNPTCEHCQAEAVEIRKNIDKLNTANILMVGSASLSAMNEFSREYQLNDLSNVHFTYTSPVYGYQLFGGIQLPHLRLYDKKFKLVKVFSGNTSVDQVITYIKEL